jgi:signal peptidase I
MESTDERHSSVTGGGDTGATESGAPASNPGAASEHSSSNSSNHSHHSLRNEIRIWTRDLLIAIGLALVIIVFLYQPVKVEGTSMAPLLSDQERIFINKFVYRFEPIERGDVVVFWYPLDRSKSFIKRVVALPGEMVEIRKGIVYVNGVALPEPYVPPQYEDLTDFPRNQGRRAQLLCDGRSSNQLKRFTCFWYSAKSLHLWTRCFCVLARGSLWLAVGDIDDGSENEMNFDGGHTERGSTPTRHTRAGRRAHI